jgi:cobyrinic acid a,c-diamide synthase
MAKWLGLPVMLVVDVRAMARSLGALALGFATFDPELALIGLVANRVGSEAHLDYLSQALAQVPQVSLWGGLRREAEIGIGERHLGLVTAEEGGLSDEGRARLAGWLTDGLDVDRLLDALPDVKLSARTRPDRPPKSGLRLGVARDEAFCFYYQENLRRLRAAGAELVFFSPLADEDLPPDLAGLYLGGGYPELFADRLADNKQMRRAVQAAGRAGMPIYAECGGMMYLAEKLIDLEGRVRPMSGVLPLATRMLPRLRSLGYREISLDRDAPLGPAGTVARGHEFHYSEIERVDPDLPDVYRAADRSGGERTAPGFAQGQVLASYVHLHFGSQPDLAANLVADCRRFQGEDS